MSNEWTADDDAAAALAGYPDGHPISVVGAFMAGMDDPSQFQVGLARLVTPESLPQWGDFSGVASVIRDWGDWGMASRAVVAEDAADVAYVRFLPNTPSGYKVEEEREVQFVGIFTTVWRPEVGYWQIHAVGQAVDAADVPRTSPNVAPQVDLWATGD